MRRRQRSKSVRKLLSFLFAALLGVTSAGIWMPTTPIGKHCPTAPVQKVADLSLDQEGRSIEITRAPQLGEKDFKQCACEEKKASEKQENVSKAREVNSAQPIILTKPLVIVSRQPLVAVRESQTRLVQKLRPKSEVPLTPPPQFIS